MISFIKKNGLLILGIAAILWMLTRPEKSELDQLLDQARKNLDEAQS
jgi:uncharacterized membrane protein YqjE